MAEQVVAKAQKRLPYRERPAMFSDGSSLPLRHGPRRERTTGQLQPAPMTPAAPKPNWNNPRPGDAIRVAKREPELLAIDSFDSYKKRQKTEPRSRASAVSSSAAYYGGAAPVMAKKDETTPHLFTAETPRLPGGYATPMPMQPAFMGAETPVVPHTAHYGAMPFGGEQTPRVHAQAWAHGAATPPVPGFLACDTTPMVPSRAAAFGGAFGGDATPMVPFRGGLGPGVGLGAETPRIGGYGYGMGDATPMVGLGAATPTAGTA